MMHIVEIDVLDGRGIISVAVNGDTCAKRLQEFLKDATDAIKAVAEIEEEMK